MLDRQFNNPTQTHPTQQHNGVSTVSVTVGPSGNTTPLPAYREIQDKKITSGNGTKFEIYDNMSTVDRIILCGAEMLGTAVLVFLGCSGCVAEINGKNYFIPPLQVCLTFGLAIMVAVQLFGHISGAHINPSVTIAAALMGVIPLIQIPLYICGQLLGSLVGFGLLQAVTPKEYIITYKNISGELIRNVGVCSPALNSSITTFQGFLMEFVVTLILVLVVCSVWDSRNSDNSDSLPLRLGLTVAALALAAGPYTGAHMNPARSFGPALINGDWTDHWVYWVGPISAGICASLIYRFIFNRDEIVKQIATETTISNENHKD